VKGATPPWSYYEARLCEEFHCLPSQLDREDPRRIEEMVLMLSYARAKERLDSAKSEDDVKRTPMIERVWDIQAAIMKDRMKRGT
jgi:hypothetical protein